MEVTLLNRGRVESDGTRSRVGDTYIVTDRTASEIPSDGSLAGLPGIGDVYATGSPLVATSILASDVSGGFRTAEVVVTYSNDGYGTLPTQPPVLAGTFGTGLNFEPFTVRIPIAELVPRTISGGGTSVDTAFWEVREASYTERMAVYVVAVELPAFGPAQIGPILEQANKIHQLSDGRKYLFRPSSVPVSTGPWRVTYSWVYDPGTPNIPYTGGADVLFPAGPGGVGLGVDPQPVNGLCRSPFHSLYTLASADPENVPPDVAQRPDYAEDLNGWQSLPGVPAL